MPEFANINRVYKVVKYFLNKGNHGYLKVDEFNSFSDFSQKDLARELRDEYRRALK